MLFLICCGWVAAGVLAYWLARRRFIKNGHEWLNRDVVLGLAVSVFSGPCSLIPELLWLFCDLTVLKAIGEWLDRPSRW